MSGPFRDNESFLLCPRCGDVPNAWWRQEAEDAHNAHVADAQALTAARSRLHWLKSNKPK